MKHNEDKTTENKAVEAEEEKLPKPVPKETEQRCDNCKFFDHRRGQNYGNCRRYPPNHGYTGNKEFPQVGVDYWCGEYKEC